MKEKSTYICENCGQEFEEREECLNHEVKCCSLHFKYKENVEKAVAMAISDYGSIIDSQNIKVKIDEEVDTYNDFVDKNSYKFEIDIKLTNGNSFSIYDGFDEDLWLGNYLEADTIYKSLKREIEYRLPLEYEGTIYSEYNEDGWREDKIGDVLLSDITDRLDGRKVKIAVVE